MVLFFSFVFRLFTSLTQEYYRSTPPPPPPSPAGEIIQEGAWIYVPEKLKYCNARLDRNRITWWDGPCKARLRSWASVWSVLKIKGKFFHLRKFLLDFTGMAYPGFGAPPPGGYGGVSKEWIESSVKGMKLRDASRSLLEIGRHFEPKSWTPLPEYKNYLANFLKLRCRSVLILANCKTWIENLGLIDGDQSFQSINWCMKYSVE